jgi:hypothetical protein
MRKSISLFILSICLLFLSGCQETAMKQKPNQMGVKGKGKIPNVMVGVWQAEPAEGAIWAFKIEPDGSIPKLIHPVAGDIDVKEGGYEKEGPDPNTFEVYIMGPCESSFDSTSGILTVHIVLDGFTLKLPQGELTGKSDDYFKGKASKDGKTWEADWFNYGWLEGASPPDVNYVNANPQKLIFKKIDLKKLAEPNGVK